MDETSLWLYSALALAALVSSLHWSSMCAFSSYYVLVFWCSCIHHSQLVYPIQLISSDVCYDARPFNYSSIISAIYSSVWNFLSLITALVFVLFWLLLLLLLLFFNMSSLFTLYQALLMQDAGVGGVFKCHLLWCKTVQTIFPLSDQFILLFIFAWSLLLCRWWSITPFFARSLVRLILPSFFSFYTCVWIAMFMLVYWTKSSFVCLSKFSFVISANCCILNLYFILLSSKLCIRLILSFTPPIS